MGAVAQSGICTLSESKPYDGEPFYRQGINLHVIKPPRLNPTTSKMCRVANRSALPHNSGFVLSSPPAPGGKTVKTASILVLVLLSVSCQSIRGHEANIIIYHNLAEARERGCPSGQILARLYRADDRRPLCVPATTNFCEGSYPKLESVNGVYSAEFCDPMYERIR